ncbi:MAG: isoprenylcysteine carboxylmethyltransferase family protein [Spirochaetes bacterium]|nr:isoprenylcysteine carboxylmethyltransferase family protein [Spirochaetota bacterium]
MSRTTIKPHIYFVVFMILIPASYLLLQPLQLCWYPYNFAGIPVFIAGLWLLMKSLKTFQDNNTPERIDQMPAVIVAEGPYRFTRNPQYLGGFFMLLGTSIIAPTLPGFALPFLFILFIQILFISGEEKKMSELFGPEYEEYRNRVRRWI